MRMTSRASFSRRRVALGFAAILAFPVVPAFAGRKRSAGEIVCRWRRDTTHQRPIGADLFHGRSRFAHFGRSHYGDRAG
jgi:hypothetical protein